MHLYSDAKNASAVHNSDIKILWDTSNISFTNKSLNDLQPAIDAYH